MDLIEQINKSQTGEPNQKQNGISQDGRNGFAYDRGFNDAGAPEPEWVADLDQELLNNSSDSPMPDDTAQT